MVCLRGSYSSYGFDYFSLIAGYVNAALVHLEKGGSRAGSQREAGVLEKLLKIDKNVAVVMATDMLTAGVDTVKSQLTHEKMSNYHVIRHF